MPPKKSKIEADKAKELKKKNTDEAKKIISMMMPSTVTSMDNNSSSVSSPNGIGAEIGSFVDVAALVETPPEKAKKSNAKKTTYEKDDKSSEKHPPRKTSQTLDASKSKISTKVDLPSSKLRAKSSDDKNASNIRLSKAAKKTAAFRYEIDCIRVSDSINVIDLQKYVEMQLKVNGKKNNLGDTVTVLCENQKVVIKSKVFIPKRSLRFLWYIGALHFVKLFSRVECIVESSIIDIKYQEPHRALCFRRNGYTAHLKIRNYGILPGIIEKFEKRNL